jgi:hypothetical protein
VPSPLRATWSSGCRVMPITLWDEETASRVPDAARGVENEKSSG